MFCRMCHAPIEEFVVHERQNPKGRIIRWFRCIIHGRMNPQTMLPIEA